MVIPISKKNPMKTNVPDRLTRLEAKLKPKPPLPAAWLAIIEVDGKVSASHVEHGTHDFDDIDEFEAFRKEMGIVPGDYIQVVIVNAKDCKGADPLEK